VAALGRIAFVRSNDGIKRHSGSGVQNAPVRDLSPMSLYAHAMRAASAAALGFCPGLNFTCRMRLPAPSRGHAVQEFTDVVSAGSVESIPRPDRANVDEGVRS